MKKATITIAFSVLLIPISGVSAQMMYGNYYDNNSASTNTDTDYSYGMMGYPVNNASTSTQTMDAEEVAGQAIAQKLQNKTIPCTSLSQSDYSSLGEYYMGLMMGSGHDEMDQVILNRYGSTYDDQMHIAMGERFSGCNTNVSFPAGMMGFGPMMGGLVNNGNYEGGYGMMGWGFPGMFSRYGGYYGLGSMIFMFILWALAIVGLVVVIKWAVNKSKK